MIRLQELARTRIGAKIFGGYLIMFAAIASFMGAGVWKVGAISERVEKLTRIEERIRLARELDNLFLQEAIEGRALPLLGANTRARMRFDDLQREIDARLSKLRALAADETHVRGIEIGHRRCAVAPPQAAAAHALDAAIERYINVEETAADAILESILRDGKYRALFPFLRQMIRNGRQVYEESAALQEALRAENAFLNQIAAMSDYLVYGTAEFVEAFDRHDKRFRLACDQLERSRQDLGGDKDEARALHEIAEQQRLLSAAFARAVQAYKRDGRRRALTIRHLWIDPAEQGLKNLLRGFYPLELAKIHQAADHVQRDNRTVLSVIAALNRAILFVLLIVLALGASITNGIVGPLRRLLATTRQVAAGDLSARTMIGSSDEIGALARSFDAMVASLQKAQARMVQTEKLSAVGQLAAGVAHEINNPLAVILGFAQGLARGVPAGDELELPIRSIEREALRCKSLVQDLLTFARTAKSERRPMALNDAVERALMLIAAQAKMMTLSLRCQLAPGLPPILGNDNQLQQVVVNLCRNAMDAMPEGGTLSVTTELLEGSPHSWVCLRVADSGAGIAAADLPKIFDPFFTTKPVGQGTGLGLSLVNEIVAKHSGSIGVESRPGRTVFTLKFPARTGRELEDRRREPRREMAER